MERRKASGLRRFGLRRLRKLVCGARPAAAPRRRGAFRLDAPFGAPLPSLFFEVSRFFAGGVDDDSDAMRRENDFAFPLPDGERVLSERMRAKRERGFLRQRASQDAPLPAQSRCARLRHPLPFGARGKQASAARIFFPSPQRGEGAERADASEAGEGS